MNMLPLRISDKKTKIIALLAAMAAVPLLAFLVLEAEAAHDPQKGAPAIYKMEASYGGPFSASHIFVDPGELFRIFWHVSPNTKSCRKSGDDPKFRGGTPTTVNTTNANGEHTGDFWSRLSRPGTYEYKLTCTSITGSSVSETVQVTVRQSSSLSPPKPLPPKQFTLSVDAVPSGAGSVTGLGIACPLDCTEIFPEGSGTVILTARPSAGWQFKSWGGDCFGSSSSCAVKMDEAKNVSAIFAQVSLSPSPPPPLSPSPSSPPSSPPPSGRPSHGPG